MFVITGATGHTGSVAARALLEAGRKVRVVVRDAAKASRLKSLGAEVFVADLADQAALAEAVRGAEGVFLISPPDLTAKDFVAERQRLTQQQIETLKAAKVPHVVLLSSIGAQQPSGTGPILTTHNAEQQLRASGLSATFVRAGYFVENWAAVIPAVKNDGVLPSFIAADQRVPSVSTVDIGKAIAQALLDGPRGVRVIELSGPTDVSPNEVAATFARILGKPVHVAQAPLDAVVPTFKSFGLSENIAGLFRELYEGLANGRIVPEPGEHVRGTTPLESTLRALLA
ncbi:MAG TPA: NmrA family NAD(P)-binding protein [Polyangiaceae bacterium]|nr:NmrA family NAD(P)-binding protein [Polyangiaceae bacterium]